MASIIIREGEDLVMEQYLVTSTGAPISDLSMTLSLFKMVNFEEMFFDGDGWTRIPTTIPYTESNTVPGVYRLTIPASVLAVGMYTAISNAPDKGALLESVEVISKKSTRRVTVI